MKNLRLYILIALIAVTASVLAIKVNAQANGNTGSTGSYSPFKVLNGVILPQSTAWTLKLPYLGGSGSKLVCVDNNGLVAITGCPSSGGGGSGGGTWATTTSNVSGQLVNYSLNDTDIVAIGNSATTSAEFYFDPNLQYSFLIGTTTHSKAIQIGATAGDHGIFQTVSRTYGASVTTGGAWNLTNTLNDGAGLVLVTAHAGSATGRLFALNCSNAAFDQDCQHIDSAGTADGLSVTNTNAGTSANAVSLTGIGDYTLRVGYTGSNANKGAAIFTNSGAYTTADFTGQPLGQGVIKINSGGVADTDASGLSIDTSLNSSVMQGIFLKGNATGKLLNVRGSDDTEYLTMLATGKIGVASSTPTGARFVVNSVASDLFSFQVGSTTNPWLKVSNTGFGTTTLSGFNVNGSATSTSNVGFNITAGCFAINGACISGSGGAGTVTGSGSIGKIPKWTSSTALGDSIITESSSLLTIAGDVVPSSDQNQSLGYSSNRWTTLYLGSGAGGEIDFNSFGLRFSINDGTPVGKWLANGNLGVGTSTPYATLTSWGGTTKIFEAVTQASTTALSVSATGFATTTLSGLNISGSATSTSNVGFNLTTGCFAISGVCISGSGGGSGTVTSITLGAGHQNQGLVITTSGTIVGAIATSATPVINPAGLSYWTGTGDVSTPAKLGTTATSTLTGTGPISISNNPFIISGSGAVVSCATATGSIAGCLAASDFSKFNSATTTFSTGLTYTGATNAVTVNTTQNITTLSGLTTNGFVTTSGGTGALSVTVPGTGVSAWVVTPSSANLATAITDETGSGALVFGTTPSFTTSALFPTGSVTVPGIAFVGDTNTGIYQGNGADTLDFTTGGVWRGGFTNNGNFDLGTTTPFAQFTVATTSANAGFKPQFVMTDMNAPLNGKHWYMSSMLGKFELGTTSDTGTYATSTAFSLQSGRGFFVGTSTPSSSVGDFIFTSGASATTTINIGEIGLTTSKSCVNMNTNTGSAASFYIVGGSIVVEANYCK